MIVTQKVDNIVVTGSADGEVRLWSTQGKSIGTLARRDLGNVSSICISSTDSNHIVVTVDMRFLVFDIRRRLCAFRSHLILLAISVQPSLPTVEPFDLR